MSEYNQCEMDENQQSEIAQQVQKQVFSLALLRSSSFKKLLFPDFMVISVLVSATQKATLFF